MDFVDEENGALAQAAQLFRVGHHGFDFLDAAEHGAEGDELAAGHARNQFRQRGLAHARRAPENNRRQLIALNLPPQRLLRPQNMLLADVIFQALRTHALGQRTHGGA